MKRKAAEPIRVCLWAMPRAHSTSLLYSFAQRSDTWVWDEPLYAHWLARHPEAARAGTEREDTLRSQSSDGALVLQNVMLSPSPPVEGNGSKSAEPRVLFFKNIGKFAEGIDIDTLIATTVSVFLVREPAESILSFQKGAAGSDAVLECGIHDITNLVSRVQQHGRTPIVIEARKLLLDPEGVLRALCEQIGIDFDPAMLRWNPGPKPYDGVWAPNWYATVHQSQGFEPHRPSNTMATALYPPGPSQPDPAIVAATEAYESLLPLALRRKAIHTHATSTTIDHGQVTAIGSLAVERRGLSPTTPEELRPYLPDPRNADIFCFVGDRVVPRNQACVSVFDSSVQGGDSVWEGLRVYAGRIFCFDEHVQRLRDSAKTLAFAGIPSVEQIHDAVFQTLKANGMRDGAHIRLTLTRGCKVTSGMSPAFNRFGSLLIVAAEWKDAVYNPVGTRLITSSVRRNGPSTLDSKIHHNNLLNNILAKIEANVAAADDALMLDPEGFVAETNATNVFCVRKGVLVTPHGEFCLPGITRKLVLSIARHEAHLPVEERRVSLSEFYTADEVFTTGTMGELSPVTEIDGRVIGNGEIGSVTKLLQRLHGRRARACGTVLPF